MTDDPNTVSVYLPCGCDRVLAVENIKEAAPVFMNIFSGIFIEASEIKVALGKGRNAS